MNEEQITFWVDEKKFTTKLVPDTKPQNKVHYYTMNELEDVIDLTLIEDDITEALKEDDENHPIMIESKENSTSSDEDTKLIPSKLKDQYLDEAIAFYKNKYRQYIYLRMKLI